MRKKTGPKRDQDDLLAPAAALFGAIRDGVSGARAIGARSGAAWHARVAQTLDAIDASGAHRLTLARVGLWCLGAAFAAIGIVPALITVLDAPMRSIPVQALTVATLLFGLALLAAREVFALRSRLVDVAGLDRVLLRGGARLGCGAAGGLLLLLIAPVIAVILAKTRPVESEEILFLLVSPVLFAVATMGFAHAYRDRLSRHGWTAGGAMAAAIGVSGAVCAGLLGCIAAVRELEFGLARISVLIAMAHAAAVSAAGFANQPVRRHRRAGRRALKGFAGATLLTLALQTVLPWIAFALSPSKASMAWGILILLMPLVLISSLTLAFWMTVIGWRLYRSAFACSLAETSDSDRSDDLTMPRAAGGAR